MGMMSDVIQRKLRWKVNKDSYLCLELYFYQFYCSLLTNFYIISLFFCRRCIKFRTRLKSFVEIQNEIQSFDRRRRSYVSRISFVFLNRRDYDSSSRTNYQKCTLGSARNLISSPRYYFSVAAKQYLEDVSLGVGGFSICLLVEKKGRRRRREAAERAEGRKCPPPLGRRAGEEGEASEERCVFSTSPKGNYWQSARKWRRKYHVAGAPPRTRSFLFADLKPPPPPSPITRRHLLALLLLA